MEWCKRIHIADPTSLGLRLVVVVVVMDRIMKTKSSSY
jgi:hypothetical protein